MKSLVVLALFATFGVAQAADAPAKADKADPRGVIASKFPGVSPDDVKPSPIPGVWEVRVGANTGYASADGKYLINGDLYEIDTRTNLSERGRAANRKSLLASIQEKDTIVFSPAGTPKHSITVFTDVDCGYCRKLHSEIDRLTQLGIRVCYAAYPRSGPGSPDWKKMEAVWCSKDRKAAITQAKRGESINAPDCGATVVAKQFELGEQIGVEGTPAIFTVDGDYIGGYLPPDRMLAQLDELKAGAAKK